MIDRHLAFQLPAPWVGKQFEIQRLGVVNFLVGPNASGKSRFASALKAQLNGARLLGTDRLRGMEKDQGMGFLGEPFNNGFQKNQFQHIRNAGAKGFGIDTLVILEERLDISNRINRSIEINRDQ